MKTPENKSLDEIKDPLKKAKLTGIQEVAYDLDAQLVEARTNVAQCRSEARVVNVVAMKILEECAKITKGLKDGLFTKEETRVRVDQTKKLIDVIQSYREERVAESRNSAVKLEALERAHAAVTSRFDQEARQAERWQRIHEEDEAREAANAKAAAAAKKAAKKKVTKKKRGAKR